MGYCDDQCLERLQLTTQFIVKSIVTSWWGPRDTLTNLKTRLTPPSQHTKACGWLSNHSLSLTGINSDKPDSSVPADRCAMLNQDSSYICC